MTYEELRHSSSGSKPRTKELLGGFKTFAASEMQAEIVKPRKNSGASYSSSSKESTPSKASRTESKQPSFHSMGAAFLDNDEQLPACAGEIKVLVQVKHQKNFLKLIKHIIQQVVMEQHLY